MGTKFLLKRFPGLLGQGRKIMKCFNGVSSPKFSKFFLLIIPLIIVFGLGFSGESWAGGISCDPNAAPFDTDSCQFNGLPICWSCQEVSIGVFQCEPDDSLCDLGNPCTSKTCTTDLNEESFGCQTDPLVLGGNTDLPIECYLCEPTANNVFVDNGICDRGAMEDCSNTEDCRSTTVTDCTFPDPGQVPPPNDLLCESTDPTELLPAALCDDGDICTADFCLANSSVPATCVNVELVCLPDPDGCCPLDPQTGQPCFGPAVGDPNGCREVTGAPIPGCDADCWPPQACGDGVVQAPETCDDSANLGLAGVKPGGSSVTDSECRDQGTQFECTYCGDGIVQSPLEQCELNEAGACGGAGCGPTCLCQADICLEGSGDLLGGEGNAAAPLPEFCDTCSLHREAKSKGAKNYLGYLGIILVLIVGMVQRQRTRLS